MNSLNKLREKIDATDDAVLKLLVQRAQLAEQVASIKKVSAPPEGIQYFRPERESQIIRRLLQLKKEYGLNFTDASIKAIYREIIAACLSLEQQQIIAYLGPEETYTHQVSQQYFGQSNEFVSLKNINAIFDEVTKKRCHFGVVPIENSYEGTVHQTIDALIKYENIKVCLELMLPIEHCFMSFDGNDFSKIHTIVAHEQTIGQCRRWLERFPDAHLQNMDSNAGAVKLVKEKGSGYAAIASEQASIHYEVPIVQRRIQDALDNRTRFLVIGDCDSGISGNDRTALLIAVKNQPGTLFNILQPFANEGISLSSISSRPSHQALWDYIFYIEVDGHAQEEALKLVLEKIKTNVELVRVLGSFPRAN